MNEGDGSYRNVHVDDEETVLCANTRVTTFHFDRSTKLWKVNEVGLFFP